MLAAAGQGGWSDSRATRERRRLKPLSGVGAIGGFTPNGQPLGSRKRIGYQSKALGKERRSTTLVFEVPSSLVRKHQSKGREASRDQTLLTSGAAEQNQKIGPRLRAVRALLSCAERTGRGRALRPHT